MFRVAYTNIFPSVEYQERGRLLYKDFIRHYGTFMEVFGAPYDSQDTVVLEEGLYETLFISSY